MLLVKRNFETSNPLLTIIIVNYNSEKFFDIVKKCIEAIFSIPLSKEIIVIDNGSHDSSRLSLMKLIKDQNSCYSADLIRLILLNNNIGFQKAVNVALSLSTSSKYVMVVNNDCIINSKSIVHLIKVLERMPAIGCIQGKILNMDGTSIDSAGCVITDFGDWLKIGYRMSNNLFNLPLITSYVHAVCFICRREAFPGFLSDFFAFGDDFELGPRLYANGYCCLYYPVIIGQHYGSATSIFNKNIMKLNEYWSIIGQTAILRVANPISPIQVVLGMIRVLLECFYSTLTLDKKRTRGIVRGFIIGLQLRFRRYRTLKQNKGKSIKMPSLRCSLKDFPNLLLRSRRQITYLKYIPVYIKKHGINA
ncbi:MAG: glycosyltransferase family 2 protein [Sulfolobales archaeon]|nr:glycosyltransferase family 2 protein [Sulfolobales archaeon]